MGKVAGDEQPAQARDRRDVASGQPTLRRRGGLTLDQETIVGSSFWVTSGTKLGSTRTSKADAETSPRSESKTC
jgi:hypothetical protein